MRKSLLLLISALLAGSLPWLSQTHAAFQEKKPPMSDYEGKVNAPEFPEELEWLNTDRPLLMRQLRGKVVLLDFWTYCCINCMHVIPDLKRLEKKYANELVVIGVHSAEVQRRKRHPEHTPGDPALRDRAPGDQRLQDGSLAVVCRAVWPTLIG
jgi:thiol-disulfide isomerase/thioredoxin